jgi:uncharacterized protein with HEPN domain
MTPHSDRVRLLHMLDHAVEAVDMARGRSRADLDADRRLNLSLVRLIEIVGEAASRVSSSAQERHPEIPWQDIIGMRNRIVHGYDRVDFDILWDVVELHLPPLIAQLKGILGLAGESPE